MFDPEKQQEIRRLRSMLLKMAELAEHVEQTGSFESGVRNNIRRYNKIVEHLEDSGAIPDDLFPKLSDDADSGQVGSEAMFLADYLGDLPGMEEPQKEPNKPKVPDIGMAVALAPFLEKHVLTDLVHRHLGGTNPEENNRNEFSQEASTSIPDLKTIIGLAPHIDRHTLGELARACLSHQKLTDPHLLVALAPHMDKNEFSQLVREHLPQWFATQAPESPAPPAPPEPPAPPTAETQVNWMPAIDPFPNQNKE